jgi:glutaminyl-tRNA synthetase
MVIFRRKSRLRAKIDMYFYMLMRDPLIYRVFYIATIIVRVMIGRYIRCMILLMASDYIEQISHSICTLEFVMHRELYNWF